MAHYILGISAFYHDSAACLLKDGVVVCAVQEERFTRKKNDESFPIQSIQWCLSYAGISVEALELVVFYEKPFLKFERILDTYIAHAPYAIGPFIQSVKSWLHEKIWVSSIIKDKLNYNKKIIYATHHESHAASACFTSPFSECAFLTVDGVGERNTSTFGVMKDSHITTLAEQNFPNSLGLFYSAFTFYCGFKVNSGEYKLMGLAPYGKPIYKEKIYQHLVEVKTDGSLILNMDYFGFQKSLKMINKKFCALFGRPACAFGSAPDEFYKDVAASVQEITEEIILKMARHVREKTGMRNLSFAGGVALNCAANGKLQQENIFDNIWIQPAAGDAGGALGAALIGWHHYLKNKFVPPTNFSAFLGPEFSEAHAIKLLSELGVKFTQLEPNSLNETVSDLLAEKNVVGWFNGRMEWGPRALGSRSILASPQFADMKDFLNLKIKKREGFRPFAPVVMEEFLHDWFDMKDKSEFMLFNAPCKQPDKIPSSVHVNQSSRVQTVSKNSNGNLHGLLQTFHRKTGIPVLINTSFNVRGEPMVGNPEDALRCFFQTEMDALVIGNLLVLKKDNPKIPTTLSKSIAYEKD